MRRAPIYLLIDTSGSMTGEPIVAVQNGLKTCIEALRTDPNSLEKAYVSIITFATEANVITPLTFIQDISDIPNLEAKGATAMGAAVELLNNHITTDLIETKKGDDHTEATQGDYKAFVVLLTDGYATDKEKLKEAVTHINRHKIKYFICATTSEAQESREHLKMITNTDEVIYLPTSDSKTFQRFFEWVSQSASASIESAERNGDDDNNHSIGELPPLPNFKDDDELLL